MTSPARQQPLPTVFSPLSDGTPEGPGSHEPSPEVRDALHREQAELQREVIRSHRWVRYVAVTVLAGAAIVLSRKQELPLGSLVTVVVAYIVCVFITGWAVQRAPATTQGQWLSALLITADLATVGSIIYLTSPPMLAYRFLILAILSVQLAAFYFGWGPGLYATVLSAVIYVLVAHVLPPTVPGPRPAGVLNIAIFGLVAGFLVFTFGNFRARMNKLRLFCKVVEEGDLGSALELTKARYPDDLTLLARSFDAMRNGLAEQIGTDPLTGCLNRRALESRLKSDWRLAKRRGTHVALAAIDLDRFKQINDTRGHPVGDIVLQQLAGIMKSTARDTDAVARFGGDEFVILLPDTGWQGALTFAERLRRRVDDFTFGPPGSPMTLTISVGVALARGTDPLSPEELLKEADRSLYKAKQQGRNRVFA